MTLFPYTTLFRSDSNLVVQQAMNKSDALSDNMVAYREVYNLLEAKFEGCELKHIGRGSNEEADTLANIGSTCSAIPDGVFYEVINQRSIKYKLPAPSVLDSGATLSAPADTPDENIITGPAQQVFLVEAIWTRPFLAYLLRQELPEDQDEARRIVRRLKAYAIVEGELYKRSVSGILQ